MLLMPEVFGGQDIAPNVVYVPVGLADVKRGIDENTIAPMARDGKVTSYAATPEYSGDSFIPIAVTINAANPGSFSSTIAIWGEALTREQG
jgi:hypothetical protein